MSRAREVMDMIMTHMVRCHTVLRINIKKTHVLMCTTSQRTHMLMIIMFNMFQPLFQNTTLI